MNSWIKTRLVPVAAGFLAVCMIAGCAGGSAPPSESPSADATFSAEQTAAPSETAAPTESAEPSESAAESVPATSNSATLGDFSVKDINGTEYTQEMFAKNKLTLVNIMATWCGPCVAEMPDLAEVAEKMAPEGVGIAGIVLDTTYEGKDDPDAIATAKMLAEQTGVKYPLLIPGDAPFGGVIDNVQAVPTSYLVDSTGTIIAGPIEGSRSAQEWTTLIQEALASVA